MWAKIEIVSKICENDFIPKGEEACSDIFSKNFAHKFKNSTIAQVVHGTDECINFYAAIVTNKCMGTSTLWFDGLIPWNLFFRSLNYPSKYYD